MHKIGVRYLWFAALRLGGRQRAVNSARNRECFGDPSGAAVKLDSGSQEHLGGRVCGDGVWSVSGNGFIGTLADAWAGSLTPALSRWEREQDRRNAALGIASVRRRRFFEITLTDYHLLSFLWSVDRNEIPHPKPRSSTTLLCFASRFEGAPAGVVPC